MILAAGEGRRMAPLSTHCAKPALPVLDQPLVHRMVCQLAEQGIEEVVVNTHTSAESVRRALDTAPIPVHFSHELELLGGGGGIRAARRFLAGRAPFLVLNGDMCLDLDVAALVGAHARGGRVATLGLRDDPRKGSFGSIGYDLHQHVCRITDRFSRDVETGSGLFIGVHVLEQAIFDRMPERETFDILSDVYIPMLRSGEPIGVWLQPAAASWFPVGCPEELLDVNLCTLERIARNSGPPRSGLFVGDDALVSGDIEAPAWIGADARVEAGAQLGPGVVVGRGAVIPRGARLERALVLPGARPPAAELCGAICYGEETWRRA
jgi:NDP-sugar pyrophosphorylase family protein